MKEHSTFINLWKYAAILLIAALSFPISGTAQSIDLKLELTSNNANSGIFENVTITATVTNEGNDTATGVMLEFPTFPSDLPVTGDPMETQGFFSNWWTGTGTWDVGTLEADSSASVVIGLFPLAENIDFYGEVASANGNDTDSTPGNGTSPNPNEDDEAAITINDTGGGDCDITILVNNNGCNDNGTPNDPIDDYLDVSFVVEAQNTSSPGYQVEISLSGTTTFSYGTTVSAQPSIAALNGLNNGIFRVTVVDLDNPDCTDEVEVLAPPSCSNGSGVCELTTSVDVSACSDNGTPDFEFDDMFQFDLTVNGQNTSGNWTADLPIPSASSTTLNGVVGPNPSASAIFNISSVNALPGGLLTFIVEDENDATCNTTVSIAPPPTCSNGNGTCGISATSSNIQCSDNGTDTNAADDVWSFDLTVNSTNASSTYFANINGQTFSGSYGGSTSFGLFPISAGDVNVVLTDSTDPSCTTSIAVAAPAPCSNGGGGNGIDLELSMTSPTSNPNVFTNGTVVLTVANTGTIAATDVQVAIPSPVGYVYQGGNEFDASQGHFNFNGNQVWTVGTLAAGANATLDINYFFLADPNGIANYAQVINANETDADSTPDNGTCCTPNEDDEAVFTFGGAVTTPDLLVSDFTENWPTPLAVGVQYPFTFDLQNVGAGMATGNYRVGVYLSTDGFLDGNDFLIGEVATGDTPVGTISAVPGLVEVTANVPDDTYFVLLVADDLDEISETNENNNIQVSSSTYMVENNSNVCTGLFVANSQAELNQFNPSCTVWAGAIELGGNITDLSPLSNLTNVLGNITFQNTALTDLTGLENLQATGALFFIGNSNLTSFQGLSPNFETDALQIISNSSLQNLNTLPAINTLNDLTIANNAALANLNGLSVLSGDYPNLSLTISSNPQISSLAGLENITQLGFLSIGNNNQLSECCAIFDLLNNNGVNGTTNIANNEMGCNNVQDILDNCAVSNCQIMATVLDIQCQSNLTLTNSSDDTFTARILVEGSPDCIGNFQIDGQNSGIFGSIAIFGGIATVGPYPISGGDVTIEITDFQGSSPVQLTLNAPAACSNGVDPNECGFEETYVSFPSGFSSTITTEVTENGNGYSVETFGNISATPNFDYFDLEINFAGTELSNNSINLPGTTFARTSDGNFFQSTDLPNNQMEIAQVTENGTEIWSNIFTFDTGGPQSPADMRDVIELSDGYAFLISAFGVNYTTWILRTDFDGNLIYNNASSQPSGFNSFKFDQLANNGDFIIYRENDSRTGQLIRASAATGNILYEQSIVGDLVTNRFGGFAETPDGNFVYASYLEFPFPILAKFDAFTGEIQWEIRLTDVFSPDNTTTFGNQADVVATSDGGAVVGYSRRSPPGGIPTAYEYGRVNAAGNLVWSRELPDTYELNAKLATSDGGFIFTGKINDEYAVVKTTSEGLLTPTCIDNGGGQCSISATANNIFCDDQGTPDNPLDDKFGFELLVTGTNAGSGWTATDNSSGQQIIGQYGVLTTYPDLFFIQNGASFLIEDNDDASCSTILVVTPPAPCSNGGGGNGIDLELNITDAPSSIAAWTNISVDYTITNTGTDAESGIKVVVPLPAGVQYQGGNESSTTQGEFYPYNGNMWGVGALAAGESATLTINYFVLAANDPISLYGQVSEQDGTDADSAAGNGSCCTANEDDEADLVLTTSTVQPLVAGQHSNNALTNQAFLIEKLYPNPTTHSFKIELASSLETDAVLQIANVSGTLFLQKNVLIEQGQTVLEMNVAELPRGVYFLKMETENGVLVERFLKE